MTTLYDTIILGGGPCGCTAALYCARAGLRTLLLEQLSAGGQMALTSQIDNYPGFPDGVDGFALAEKMLRQAKNAGAAARLEQVLSLALKRDPKTVQTNAGTYHARTVILAAGAVPRTLHLAREDTLTDHGVHYCAACDGMFYQGKTVAVAGGGDSAVTEALTLARFCKHVFLIHRRDRLRAAKLYQDAIGHTTNITFCKNSRVVQLLGDERLSGLLLEDTRTHETTRLDCDGLFVSIGRIPATDLVKDQLALDASGYVPANETCRTELPGVFAAGDLRAKAFRQIVTAVADGANAAHFAEQYLADTGT